MILELSDEEARDLRAVLDTQIDELHDEARHTDDRRYRAMIVEMRERMQRVAARLDEVLGFAHPPA